MSLTEEITTLNDTGAEEDAATPAPSGFVLKLFQMVNGSDDEIIKVRNCGGDRALLKSSNELVRTRSYEKSSVVAGTASAVQALCLFLEQCN